VSSPNHSPTGNASATSLVTSNARRVLTTRRGRSVSAYPVQQVESSTSRWRPTIGVFGGGRAPRRGWCRVEHDEPRRGDRLGAAGNAPRNGGEATLQDRRLGKR
jgi:hypothetical protein